MKISDLNEAFHPGFQIYCDLDGVLVDFEKAAGELIGLGPDAHWSDIENSKENKTKFWKMLRSMDEDTCEDYWANLDWHPGGQKLWKFISKYKPIILSKPDSNTRLRDACERGKYRWVHDNIKPTPKIILDTEKWKYARPDAILIDDFEKNTRPFEEAGGSAILFRNTDQAINELKDRFGFK